MALFTLAVDKTLEPYGLTSNDLRSFKYDGGDHDTHLNRWIKLYGNKPLPAHVDRCLCNHRIKNNCYIIKDDLRLVIGNCCIKVFDIDKRRRCDVCEEPHKNTKDNYCNQCRVDIRRYKKEILGVRLVQGKYAGERFVDILKTDPDAIGLDNPKRIWFESKKHIADEIDRAEKRQALEEAAIKAAAEQRLATPVHQEFTMEKMLTELNALHQ